MTIPEELVEILVIEPTNALHLEFQERILPRIHVDGMNVRGTGQSVIKCIATGRCDDEHSVLVGQIKSLMIQPRIFPARVVDQVVTVNEFEDTPTYPIA